MEVAEVREDEEVTGDEVQSESQDQDHVSQGREDEPPGHEEEQVGDAQGEDHGEEQETQVRHMRAVVTLCPDQHHVVRGCEEWHPGCDEDKYVMK